MTLVRGREGAREGSMDYLLTARRARPIESAATAGAAGWIILAREGVSSLRNGHSAHGSSGASLESGAATLGPDRRPGADPVGGGAGRARHALRPPPPHRL